MLKRHFSCGGVVYRSYRGKLQFLFIKNFAGRWIFPKGTIELEESRQQTALREVQEETGLKKLSILQPLGKSRYLFVNLSPHQVLQQVAHPVF